MRHPFMALTGVALLGALSAAPAAGQESTTRGFVLGLHATGASLVNERDERSNAGGGGLLLGYGVNRRITIFAQADGAEFDREGTGPIEGTWTMGHFDLGVRFHFANSLSSFVPFLQGAIGVRAVSVKDPIVNGTPRDEVSFTGTGVTLGGGLDIYFSETLALDVQLVWTGGEFTTIRIDNVSVSGLDQDATSSRFSVGIAWWP